MKSLQIRVPALENAEFTEIGVGPWRSHFLKDPVYKGRRKKTELVKVATEEEACRRNPWLSEYAEWHNSPPDSMDAVGIYYGFKEEVFMDDTMTTKRVNSTMLPISNLGYEKVLIRLKVSNCKEYLKKRYGSLVYSRGLEFYSYNSKYSWQENALRVCGASNAICVIAVTDPKDVQAIRWELGEELRPGEIYAVVTKRDNISAQIPVNKLEGEEAFWGVCGY